MVEGVARGTNFFGGHGARGWLEGGISDISTEYIPGI